MSVCFINIKKLVQDGSLPEKDYIDIHNRLKFLTQGSGNTTGLSRELIKGFSESTTAEIFYKNRRHLLIVEKDRAFEKQIKLIINENTNYKDDLQGFAGEITGLRNVGGGVGEQINLLSSVESARNSIVGKLKTFLGKKSYLIDAFINGSKNPIINKELNIKLRSFRKHIEAKMEEAGMSKGEIYHYRGDKRFTTLGYSRLVDHAKEIYTPGDLNGLSAFQKLVDDNFAMPDHVRTEQDKRAFLGVFEQLVQELKEGGVQASASIYYHTLGLKLNKGSTFYKIQRGALESAVMSENYTSKKFNSFINKIGSMNYALELHKVAGPDGLRSIDRALKTIASELESRGLKVQARNVSSGKIKSQWNNHKLSLEGNPNLNKWSIAISASNIVSNLTNVILLPFSFFTEYGASIGGSRSIAAMRGANMIDMLGEVGNQIISPIKILFSTKKGRLVLEELIARNELNIDSFNIGAGSMFDSAMDIKSSINAKDGLTKTESLFSALSNGSNNLQSIFFKYSGSDLLTLQNKARGVLEGQKFFKHIIEGGKNSRADATLRTFGFDDFDIDFIKKNKTVMVDNIAELGNEVLKRKLSNFYSVMSSTLSPTVDAGSRFRFGGDQNLGYAVNQLFSKYLSMAYTAHRSFIRVNNIMNKTSAPHISNFVGYEGANSLANSFRPRNLIQSASHGTATAMGFLISQIMRDTLAGKDVEIDDSYLMRSILSSDLLNPLFSRSAFGFLVKYKKSGLITDGLSGGFDNFFTSFPTGGVFEKAVRSTKKGGLSGLAFESGKLLPLMNLWYTNVLYRDIVGKEFLKLKFNSDGYMLKSFRKF